MEQPNRSTVYLVGADDRAAGIKRLLDEFDIGDSRATALKANYNSDDPFPASTHLETLRALVKGLKSSGSEKIVLAERSGMGDTRTVLKNRGVLDLSRKLGFDAVVLNEAEAEDWKDINAEGLHWKQGFKISRIFTESDKVVQTCCLKSHRYGGHFTLSLKNSVGMVAARPKGSSYDYMRELHSSPFQRLMIAEINRFYNLDLALMDAATGFAKGGPDRGETIEPNLLLASSDRVALDAVGVALLRHYGSTPEVMRGRIFDQEQISRAASLGVGVTSADKIDLAPLDDPGNRAAEEIQRMLNSQG
ncbi:MAG TPA: DUF362 domain-containing protein [Methanotrichaceae archaeon]|nr:DUF362 domain-containing protein [Methanotrichaceae archaeon]